MTRTSVFSGLLLCAAALLPVPALAGPREDVLYGISRCGGISADRAWLDCVYGAAQPMRAALGLSPAPASQQALVPPAMPGFAAPAMQQGFAPPQRPQRMGFFESLITPGDNKPEPATHLTSYSFDAGGYFTVTLANGQTWTQSRGDTSLARWRARPETYAVQILPAPSDLHTMKVGSGAEVYQVRQVR